MAKSLMEEYGRPEFQRSKPESLARWVGSGIGGLRNWKERHFGDRAIPAPDPSDTLWMTGEPRRIKFDKDFGKFALNEAKFLGELLKDAAYTTYGVGAHTLGHSLKERGLTGAGDWLLERGPGQGLGDIETIYKTMEYVPEGVAEFINDYVPGAKFEELGHKTGMYKNPLYDEEFAKPLKEETKRANDFYFGDNVWESKGFREWQKGTGNTDDKFNELYQTGASRWTAENPYNEWVASNIADPSRYSQEELEDKYWTMAGAAAENAVGKLSDEYLKYADGRVSTEVGGKTGVNVEGLQGIAKWQETGDMKDLEGVDLGVFQNWMETPDIMKPDETYSDPWAQQFYTDPITKFMGEIPAWALGIGGIRKALQAPQYLAKGTRYAPVAEALASGIGNLFPAMTMSGTSIPKWLPKNKLARWGVAPLYNVPRGGINLLRNVGGQFAVPIGMEAYYGHQD
jgi:hypothetical protein